MPPAINRLEAQPSAWQKSHPFSPLSAERENCPFLSPPACGRGRGRVSRRDRSLPARARRFRPRGSGPPPGLPRKRGRRSAPPASNRREAQPSAWQKSRPFSPLSAERENCPFLSPPACGRGRGRAYRRDRSLPARARRFRRGGRKPPPGLPRKRGRRSGSPAIGRLEAQPPARQEGRLFSPLPLAGGVGGGPIGATGLCRACAHRFRRHGSRPPTRPPPQAGKRSRLPASNRLEAQSSARQEGRPFPPLPLAGGVGGGPIGATGLCRACAHRFRRHGSRPSPGLPRKRGRRIEPPAIERLEARPSAWQESRPFSPSRSAGGQSLSSPPACGRGRGRAYRNDGALPRLRPPFSPARQQIPTWPPPQAGEENRAAGGRAAGSAAFRLAGESFLLSLPLGRRAVPSLPSRLRKGSGEGLPARRGFAKPRSPFPPARQQTPTRPPPRAGEEDRAAGNRTTGSAAFRLAGEPPLLSLPFGRRAVLFPSLPLAGYWIHTSCLMRYPRCIARNW